MSTSTSPVNRGRTSWPGWVKIGLAGTGAIGVVAGLIWLTVPRHREAAPARLPASAAHDDAPLFPAKLEVAPVDVAPVPPPVKPAATETPSTAAAAAPIATESTFSSWTSPEADRLMSEQRSRIVERHKQREAMAAAIDPASAVDAALAARKGDSPYRAMMQSTKFAAVRPQPVRYNKHLTIPEGTKILCTPDQALSSQLPGPVSCMIDAPVLSMDGEVPLLPKGTVVHGSIEGAFQVGQQRLPVVWNFATTPRPDLVTIPLDSPSADQMGQSGIPMDVNTHFGQRLASVAAYSVLDIATAAAQNGLSGGGRSNNYINLGSVAQAGQNLGQMEFQRNSNIPPTGERGPARQIVIYINHPIDLSDIFELVAVR